MNEPATGSGDKQYHRSRHDGISQCNNRAPSDWQRMEPKHQKERQWWEKEQQQAMQDSPLYFLFS
jgi:hypothetical protein